MPTLAIFITIVVALALISIGLYYRSLTKKDTVSYFMGKIIWPKRIKSIFKEEVLIDFEHDVNIDTEQVISLFNACVQRDLKSKKLIKDLHSLGMFSFEKKKDFAADVELNLDLNRAIDVTFTFDTRADLPQRDLLRQINNIVSIKHSAKVLTMLERNYVIASILKLKMTETKFKRNSILVNTFLRRTRELLERSGKLKDIDAVIKSASGDITIEHMLADADIFPNSPEAYPDHNSMLMDYQLAVCFGNWL